MFQVKFEIISVPRSDGAVFPKSWAQVVSKTGANTNNFILE